MRFKHVAIGILVSVTSLFLLTGQGCPNAANSVDSVDDMTSAEKQALAAGVAATNNLSQGANVTQSATRAEDEEASENAQGVPFSATFGTCPQVNIDGTAPEELGDGTSAASLVIDFGEELCDVYRFDDTRSLMCSGSASGAFSVMSRQIEVNYDMLTCDERSLDGSASLSFSRLNPGSTLTGEWDLTGTSGDDTLNTDGQGTVSYIPAETDCCDVTRIDSYQGELRWNEEEWSLSLTDVEVSYETYGTTIPYSGSATVSGPDVRTFTMTFDENSPVTGAVSVSVEGGPTFTVLLFELDEYEDLISTE